MHRHTQYIKPLPILQLIPQMINCCLNCSRNRNEWVGSIHAVGAAHQASQVTQGTLPAPSKPSWLLIRDCAGNRAIDKAFCIKLDNCTRSKELSLRVTDQGRAQSQWQPSMRRAFSKTATRSAPGRTMRGPSTPEVETSS